MPVLYVVMGPNGSGKSKFGPIFTDGIKIHDFDKRRSEIASMFEALPRTEWPRQYQIYPSDYKETMVDDYAAAEFDTIVNKCLDNKFNFAFETPFSFWGEEFISKFKSAGYYINGVFFGLNSLEESISFVKLRTMRGGHNLSISSVTDNFHQCYINLCRRIEMFDKVDFVSTYPIGCQPFVFASYCNACFKYQQEMDLEPEWFNRIREKLFR
ncbi:hypothetical protein [Bacteroides sp. 224]|uniref:hypothetical protein n=1 Tax=Bacteroides sp. 224 TaxID=2302936 RepID=UPI0013D6EFC8|nr:hypothetical protein [Bacteroides sp. 224]NDV64734.1 hypothetical protein [Bacteroides sp. 224]